MSWLFMADESHGALYLNTIMKGSTTSIAEMMMGDRRFGDNAFGRTQVVLEQTMCPEILAGFQNLRPAQLEPFQGLLLCYMDQGANPYYIDAMEAPGRAGPRRSGRSCSAPRGTSPSSGRSACRARCAPGSWPRSRP